MSTYKTLVDFRLFNHADMWEACKEWSKYEYEEAKRHREAA